MPISLLNNPAITPRLLEIIIEKIHPKDLIRLAETSKDALDIVQFFAGKRIEAYKYAREVEAEFEKNIKVILPDYNAFSKADPKDDVGYLKDIFHRFLINVDPHDLGKERFAFYQDTLLLIVRYLDVWDIIYDGICNCEKI